MKLIMQLRHFSHVFEPWIGFTPIHDIVTVATVVTTNDGLLV